MMHERSGDDKRPIPDGENSDAQGCRISHNGNRQTSVSLLHEPIAIVGIGCRLPGGIDSPSSFWQALASGVDAISEVPDERWNRKAFFDPEPGRPGKSHACRGGFVRDIDRFDPHFFGISPREAARMDPQQRLLLEVAWEAIEDGGLVLERLVGRPVGVFVGISSWDYSVLQTSFRDRGAIDAYMNTGGSLSIAANRISYCFDFRGPSAAVDTACSSALVAVHLACQSLWSGQSTLALAGGVNALLTPDWYVGFSRMGMLSPDGRCKAFDARGNGFVRAEGAGIIVLKPLARAVADGDRVYATICGTAVNQDGRSDGMTVPNRQSQEELLRQAYRAAGVNPSDVQYIEAHGTGTPVGDPIEAGAIGTVVGAGRAADRPCILGSVKTNIGHLEAGSGIAGIIKTALAIHHRQVPGNLHFEQPNPAIDFSSLRLRVPTRLESWPEHTGPSLAGVNSFGFGGTNAHVVLSEAVENCQTRIESEDICGTDPERAAVIPLSARSPEALQALAIKWREFLAGGGAEVSLADIAANAAERRAHHPHRLAIVARTKDELANSLAAFGEGKPDGMSAAGRATSGQTPRIAFVCSGQGPQWWAMGRQLLRDETVFRDTIERCDRIVRRLGPWSLLEELTAEEGRSRMSETAISQPAIFAIQVALAAVWESWGVRQEAVIGHSDGEVAAAYIAGVFDLEDAVRVIYHRGRCMDRASSHGRMLAVGIPGAEAQREIARFKDRVSLAAINSPTSTTLSGEAEALEEIARVLESRNVFTRFLQVNYAFHSAQMEPVRADLLPSLEGIRPRKATLPFFSTVAGKRVEGPELGPDYWWHNVRRTVRFSAGVEHLLGLGIDTVVELSPHPVLTAAVSEVYQARGKKVVALPSLRRREDERAIMLRTAAELHVRGHELSWKHILPGSRRFVRLPAYPWQRQRYWAESEESKSTRLVAPIHPFLGTSTRVPRPAWEARLDLRTTPYLADHRVQGVVILPAAAFVETALLASRERFGTTAGQLEDVRLINPCFPPEDGAVWLHTDYSPDDSLIRIDSRPTGNSSDWTAHFQATLRSPTTNKSPDTFDLEAVKGRCPRSFTNAACYSYFAKLGLNYGPNFQGIERCWQGRREAIGEVVLPESTSVDDYLLHPSLLDSCFQLGIVADAMFDREVGDLYLPVEIDRVCLQRPAGRRVVAHARLREKTPRRSIVDIDIYDEEGQRVASIAGLRSQKVNAAGRETLDDLLYEYQWVEKPIESRRNESSSPGAWLIFADRGGVGEGLAKQLRGRGDDCAVIAPGSQFVPLAGDRWKIDPTSREDMERLLESIPSLRSRCRGIIHLWTLDATPSDLLTTAAFEPEQDAILLSALHLLQSWQGDPSGPKPRLLLATRGAQSIGALPQKLEVSQSPLIGFGRVVANEYARLDCRLVDLDPHFGEVAVGRLIHELDAEDEEDEVAWRGDRRYVHRFVASQGEGPTAVPEKSNEPYRLATARPGTIDGLALTAVNRVPPAAGEVEIEVRAAGLNFSDVMKALGLYPGLPEGPVAFGAECSGAIAAVGDGVEGWAIGDEVIAVAPFAFASHVTTRAAFVARKPASLSFEAAATIPIAFLTASYALDHLAHLAQGERVLIHSATGGVGLAAIQLARAAGAEVFATAGSEEKRQHLRDLGIRHVMESRTLAFADQVLVQTGGRGVDVVLNSLAGEAIAKGIASLAEYGRFLEIGKRDIYQNTRIGLLPFHKNLSFFAIDLDRMMRERPQVIGKLLQRIVDQVREGSLEPLPHRVFPVADIASAFRFMQHGKHIGKVVVSMAGGPVEVVPGDNPLSLHDDASYLVVGGLGGFGLATARWLADRGARSLVLASRRGMAGEDARRAIAELEERGVRVTIAKLDVADEKDVSCLLSTMARELPPLRGVFHAAMVLEDCLLQNLDPPLLRRVLAPKVQGAWNLHAQTLNLPLDHFVLFSSLSSVFGHAGQANYAAANAFLDALAWHRRSHGLPALTVNWGHLGEVGYLAERQELSERLTRQGVLSFSVAEATSLLERALQRRAVQVSVMRVDWTRWNGLGVTGRVSPRFADLLTRTAAARDDRAIGSSTRARVRAAAPDDRHTILAEVLRDKLARVLGTSTASVDAESSLLQLGIDSLMAVEVVNWLQAELGVGVPVVELMRSPGVLHLAKLLLSRLGDGEAPAAAATELASLPNDEPFPLSHGQRALGFLHQMEPESPALNLSFCSRVHSQLDVDAFRDALQMLVDRHPALRTTFIDRDGVLMQQVHPHADVALEVVDAAGLGDEALRRRVSEESSRPFDLERGPLLRMHLFTRTATDRVFLFTAHHIIGDFWSLVVLLEEMRTCYPAALAGLPHGLLEPASDYRRYVGWQEERLASAEGQQMWGWWQRHLAGVPAVLDLPLDHPRPARFLHRGGGVPCRLDAELTAQLKELAAREHVTLFATLLAGFQAFLARYTGQGDFVVGTPYAGRPRQEFEGVVGYFVNMLPLRARVTDSPTFAALLHNVGATVLEAFDYQEFPFSLIVERLGIERDPSRSPLIQVSFTLEKAHRRGEAGASRFLLPQSDFHMEVGGLETEPFPIEQTACQADLELVLEEHQGAVDGMLCYNADLFEPATADRLAKLYRDLLAALVAAPDEPLAEVPWLAGQERMRAIEEWNQTEADLGPPTTLHALFEKQASATPDAIALRCQLRTFSYGELEAWSEQLAREMRTRGVRPGSRVVIALNRSPEMIAATLGVLKAGAAYVPVDPDTPADRLQHVIEETGASMVIEQRKSSLVLRPLSSATGTVNPDLAYVIYTSGSTGRPKGVMVDHAAACNTVRWRQQALPLGRGDRVLLCVPHQFDAAVVIIFPTLIAGAELVLAKPGEERQPAALLSRIGQDRVTVVQCLPSTLRFLLEDPAFTQACRQVRRFCCGGEPMPGDLPHRLFAVSNAELFNLYGPTETAVEATWWKCSKNDDGAMVPIGRPIANAWAYVLDEHQNPVPAGVIGELYIGGAGVALGYLGDETLTAERFLDDPFASRSVKIGAAGGLPRMFRTADRVRRRTDGGLEFLGRLDRQVKVSGYRIEPGEIESVLRDHPLIRDAVVAVRTDTDGFNRLVAYTVSRNGEVPIESLHRHLEGRLPRYMFPGRFVSLPAIPRTATGKVDVTALPAPKCNGFHHPHAVEGPRTRLEAFLVDTWSDLLGGGSIDIRDNFFELGGTSLQALVLTSRIRDKLGVHVSVSAIFDAPTVAGLAQRLRQSKAEAIARVFGDLETEPEDLPHIHTNGKPHSNGTALLGMEARQHDLIVPLQPEGNGTPLFLVHPPGGIVACYQTLAMHLGKEQAVYGVRARGLYGEEPLPDSVEDMAEEYATAIRSVQPHGPYRLGGWSLGGVFAYETAQQLIAAGEDVEALFLLDSTLPFGAANAPYLEGIEQSGREFGLNLTLQELGALTADEQLPFLWQHVKDLGLIEDEVPAEMAREIIDDLKRLFHAQVSLVGGYAIRPYPRRIVLLRPTDSPGAEVSPIDRGWSRLAEVSVRPVPGRHHTMVKEPHARVLAAEILESLSGALISK